MPLSGIPASLNRLRARSLDSVTRYTTTMQCFSELISPSAVTHALSLPFLSKAANNLVVVKTSLLQIYSFKSVLHSRADFNTAANPKAGLSDDGADGKTASAGARAERIQSTKLVLIGEYELFGTVTSLGRVKLLQSKSGGDALLIASRDAKLSLTEWDPDRCSISTISIHYYEREDLQGSPWDPPLSQCMSQVIVDPRSRCAALKFGRRNLAILPFHQDADDLVMDDLDGEGDAKTAKHGGDKVSQPVATPYAASFVLSLLALDPKLTHPVDLTFLHEFREPTFGILYSHGAVSNPLLQERRDTVSYALFTLDLEQRASTALITVDGLPYDLWLIAPLRLPIGGAMLVGSNEIIHVDESGKALGIAVNGFAKTSTTFSLQDRSDLGLRLENCVVEQLGWQSDEVAIVTNQGQLAILSFIIDGRQISNLSLRVVQPGPDDSIAPTQPTCIAIVGRGRMFIGSQHDDALILGWTRSTDRAKKGHATDDEDMDYSELEEVDDEDDLYSSEKVEVSVKLAKTNKVDGGPQENGIFRAHDHLLNLGPCRQISIDRPSGASLLDESFRLASTSNRGSKGGLAFLEQAIQLEVQKVHELGSISELWALRSENIASAGDINGESDLLIANCAGEENNVTSHAYRLTKTGIVEIQESDFDPEAGASIEVGFLNSGTRIAQVLATEIRTYEKGTFAQISKSGMLFYIAAQNGFALFGEKLTSCRPWAYTNHSPKRGRLGA